MPMFRYDVVRAGKADMHGKTSLSFHCAIIKMGKWKDNLFV